MTFLLVLSAVTAALHPNVAQAHREATDNYRDCIMLNAGAFHRHGLPTDSAKVLIMAASIACNNERSVLIQKSKEFLASARGMQDAGSLSQVIALEILMNDNDLADEIDSIPKSRKHNAPNP